MATRREEFLEVRGHRVGAVLGNVDLPGIPVVFLHGMTASNAVWEPTFPDVVRDGLPWISLSLPGHAPARFPRDFRTEDITPAMFAEVLGDAIVQLAGGRAANLVGWSTGGFAALNLALHRPELVNSVFSMCGFVTGVCTGDIHRLQQLSQSNVLSSSVFRTVFRALGLSSRMFDRSLTRGCGPGRRWNIDAAARSTGDLMLHAWRSHDTLAMYRLFRSVSRFDMTAEFPKIRTPVLVAGGSADPYTPLVQTRTLATLIPGAELRLIDGGGHMFFGEWRAEYHALLTDWLSRYSTANLTADWQSPAESPGAHRRS